MKHSVFEALCEHVGQGGLGVLEYDDQMVVGESNLLLSVFPAGSFVSIAALGVFGVGAAFLSFWATPAAGVADESARLLDVAGPVGGAALAAHLGSFTDRDHNVKENVHENKQDD